ncbi:GreA/GreB family elongation factor [Pseudomonas shirazensis]|uniref:GreA/GreB family elongation factor n=1 Tax=Pseudomonas shirazensis TaxID=2745494 RepID=UPI003D267274
MSRAFVNEDHAAAHVEQPIERRVSEQPNYVTATGLRLLQQRVAALNAQREQLLAEGDRADKQQVANTESELRYFSARVQSAQVVPPASSAQKVQIGSRVVFIDEDEQQHSVQLAGEDQADARQGLINWGSPLGRALLGAAPGDEVLWLRPAGDQMIVITAITPDAV